MLMKKVLKLINVTIVAVILAAMLGNSTACPPGEVPQCPLGYSSTFFPHPNDCGWFFHCSNGVAFCKPCPADLHWNVQMETCDFPENAECDKGSGNASDCLRYGVGARYQKPDRQEPCSKPCQKYSSLTCRSGGDSDWCQPQTCK